MINNDSNIINKENQKKDIKPYKDENQIEIELGNDSIDNSNDLIKKHVDNEKDFEKAFKSEKKILYTTMKTYCHSNNKNYQNTLHEMTSSSPSDEQYIGQLNLSLKQNYEIIIKERQKLKIEIMNLTDNYKKIKKKNEMIIIQNKYHEFINSIYRKYIEKANTIIDMKEFIKIENLSFLHELISLKNGLRASYEPMEIYISNISNKKINRLHISNGDSINHTIINDISNHPNVKLIILYFPKGGAKMLEEKDFFNVFDFVLFIAIGNFLIAFKLNQIDVSYNKQNKVLTYSSMSGFPQRFHKIYFDYLPLSNETIDNSDIIINTNNINDECNVLYYKDLLLHIRTVSLETNLLAHGRLLYTDLYLPDKQYRGKSKIFKYLWEGLIYQLHCFFPFKLSLKRLSSKNGFSFLLAIVNKYIKPGLIIIKKETNDSFINLLQICHQVINHIIDYKKNNHVKNEIMKQDNIIELSFKSSDNIQSKTPSIPFYVGNIRLYFQSMKNIDKNKTYKVQLLYIDKTLSNPTKTIAYICSYSAVLNISDYLKANNPNSLWQLFHKDEMINHIRYSIKSDDKKTSNITNETIICSFSYADDTGGLISFYQSDYNEPNS